MKHILLVEDDIDLAHSIVLGLDLIETSAEKETKLEGTSALERLKSSPAPDLMILDMHLPNVAGQDIYEIARREIPNCKIIIITADVKLAREIDGRYAGWEDLLAPEQVFTKPFSLSEFLQSVQAILAE